MDQEIADFLEELVDWEPGDVTPESYDNYVRLAAKRLLANRVIETDTQVARLQEKLDEVNHSRATLYHEEPCW